jgi:hypothetical protein
MSSQKVKCIVSGIEKRFSSKSLEKKFAKFGTIEVFRKFYVSNEAKKLLKQGVSVDDVRRQLQTPEGFAKPDLEVLFKLKLIKNRKRKAELSADERKQKEAQSVQMEKQYYEFQEKLTSCSKTYIEWATGGKDGCQVPNGGTCIRPDIYFDNEYNKAGRCSPCPYKEHCLCTNKVVSS